jgi:hypothetical protein
MSLIMQNKRLGIIVLLTAIILLIPFIAMQFSSEVKWGLFDFISAGTLLLCTGLACELVLRKVKQTSHRIVICAAILLVLFLTWAELAVGIFGTPLAGS